MTTIKERLEQVRVLFLQDVEGPLRDRVYRSLRSTILSRGLLGGDRITEVELSAALDVSRTPLREAFRLLQAEGIVTLSDRRGIVVRGMGVQDFLEIYEIRAALDVVVARNAAQRKDPELLKKIADNIEMAEFLLHRERWTELREEFCKFHNLIQEACGNARLRDLLSDLQDYSASSEFTRPTREHAPATHAHHVGLYEAIVAGDIEAAGRAALMHVENERSELLKAQPEASAKQKSVPPHISDAKPSAAVKPASVKQSAASRKRASSKSGSRGSAAARHRGTGRR